MIGSGPLFQARSGDKGSCGPVRTGTRPLLVTQHPGSVQVRGHTCLCVRLDGGSLGTSSLFGLCGGWAPCSWKVSGCWAQGGDGGSTGTAGTTGSTGTTGTAVWVTDSQTCRQCDTEAARTAAHVASAS